MAVLHDYECPQCEERVFNRMSDDVPACPTHAVPMIPRFFPKSYQPFAAFEADGPDGKPIRIESLHQLREIERTSMEAYKRGEKVAPVVFRNYSQDKSNQDVNVFGKLHPQVRRDELVTRSRRGVPFVIEKRG